jgi:hypothetical protein
MPRNVDRLRATRPFLPGSVLAKAKATCRVTIGAGGDVSLSVDQSEFAAGRALRVHKDDVVGSHVLVVSIPSRSAIRPNLELSKRDSGSDRRKLLDDREYSLSWISEGALMESFNRGSGSRRLIIVTAILSGALSGCYLSIGDALRHELDLGTTDMSEVIQWGVAANPAGAAVGLLLGGFIGAIAAVLVCRVGKSSRSE